MNTYGINAQWLEQLKSRCDIVSVLSKYIRLERKGKNYWSCCPFHHEKTPSFAVNQLEQYYHCFGCKESGDVIKFVQMYESVDFLDAVQILADSVKMELPAFLTNEEVFKLKQKKQVLKEILKQTTLHYQQNLNLPQARIALDYLNKRKINAQSIKKFEIGYSLNWDALPKALAKQNFSYQDMKEAGVVELRQNNQGAFDVLGGRLIFPIYNSQEECVGYSGRLLEKSDYAKYKNTAQTMLFNKSKAIFGINHIKKQKQQGTLDKIIIVEGQIDVISMHQAGFTQTVACLGTALTKEHARELKRYCDKIVLCFDGDSAGINATVRTLDVLEEFDFELLVVSLPQGKDPDEIIETYGKQEMQKLLDQAKPVVEFRLEVAAHGLDMALPDQRAKYVKNAMQILNTLETFSQKQIYLPIIKNISGVPVDVLMRDLNRTSGTDSKIKQALNQRPPTFADSENAMQKAVKFVLASFVAKQPYARFEQVDEQFFVNPNFKKLFVFLKENAQKGKTVTVGDLYNVFDIDGDENLKDVIYYNFDQIGNNAKQYFIDSLWTFTEQKLKQKQNDLTQKYNQATTDVERKQILLEITKVSKQLKNKKLEEI